MTYEEIKEKYPIGKVIRTFEWEEKHTGYYYTENDLKAYRDLYDKITILDESRISYVKKYCSESKVEGWLFDGENWMPAYSTWEGWSPYSDEDLENINEII